MAMVQCENRHMYDNRKHVYCPYCPVPGFVTHDAQPERGSSGTRS